MSATLIYTKLKAFGNNDEKISSLFTLVKSGRGSKYNNMIVMYEGIRFHSLSEAYYCYLLDAGGYNYKRQVRYPLPNMDGKKTLCYIADFVVFVGDSEYIIDVKGRLTNENKIKLAYWSHYYEKRVTLVDTSGPSKFTTKFLV